MIDIATCWLEAVLLGNIEASTVAFAFYNHWIVRYSVPLRLTTDQGRKFESELFNKLSGLLGITRIRTMAYRPQSNGRIERWHCTLKVAIMAHVEEPR